MSHGPLGAVPGLTRPPRIQPRRPERPNSAPNGRPKTEGLRVAEEPLHLGQLLHVGGALGSGGAGSGGAAGGASGGRRHGRRHRQQKQKQERYTKISTNGARTPGVLVVSVVLVKKGK